MDNARTIKVPPPVTRPESTDRNVVVSVNKTMLRCARSYTTVNAGPTHMTSSNSERSERPSQN